MNKNTKKEIKSVLFIIITHLTTRLFFICLKLCLFIEEIMKRHSSYNKWLKNPNKDRDSLFFVLCFKLLSNDKLDSSNDKKIILYKYKVHKLRVKIDSHIHYFVFILQYDIRTNAIPL